MNQLKFDFVAKPLAEAWQRWAIMVAGLALVAAQLLYWFVQVQPAQLLQSEMQQKQDRTLHKPEHLASMKPEEFSKLLSQAQEVDQKLKLPWNALYTFLDQASGKDLALISLEPDTTKGQLVIMAEARNFKAMLAFYSAMQGSPLFEDVALQSHVINQNDPEQPIRFRLRARWMIRS
jgi:Tfp pilus assembly protein PilN